MKNLPLIGIICSIVLFLTLENCSSSKSNDPTPIKPPDTGLNDYFDAVYLASQGFQDVGKTNAIVDGKQAWVLTDLKGDKELKWANNRTIQSPLWPAVPAFYNDEFGGYILVPNVNETYWASKSFTEIPQPYDIYVVLRDLEAVSFEGYFAVGVGLRNRGDQLELKVDSKGSTFSVLMDKPTVLAFNKRSIVRIHVEGTNTSLWINNLQVSPSKVNIGTTGGITAIGYGTNSHAAQHDFYGFWMTLGRSLSKVENDSVYSKLSRIYKPGNYPDQPFANKIKVVGNAAASPREWSVTYDFVAPTGAVEDKSKTEYQWGYYRTDSGQDLNTANYFTGPNGKMSTLKRSDFPTEFPVPGGNKTYVFVVVKVYDSNGKSWSHLVRSALVSDNY